MIAPSKLAALATLTLLPSTAAAQGLALNEIYASHSGTDDQEFIELVGAPGSSLDGVMVLIVEGEGPAAGTLDRAWDLSGLTVPSSGFFVLGDTAVVPTPDFDLGASNSIENGTETFYLVETSDTAAISALLGTQTDPEGDLVTVIPTLATILDLVGMVDPDFGSTDFVYDGAQPIGPDGSFFPAGIFRGLDAPNSWCPDSFLDFDPVANANETRTPSAQNVNCASQVNTYCSAKTTSGGCLPAIVATGAPSASAGSGFLIDGTQLEPKVFGILIHSTDGPAATPFQGGTLCLAGSVVRGSVQSTAAGAACSGVLSFDFNAYIASGANPALVQGADVYVQYWTRDPGDVFGSSLTDALAFNIGQ
jgi:hypothetical protein